MASPGEDNLQILGILSPEVRTQDHVFLSWMGVFGTARWSVPGVSGGATRRNLTGAGGSAVAQGWCLREKLPPAAHLISAANYVFTHFIIRVQKEQPTGGCAIYIARLGLGQEAVTACTHGSPSVDSPTFPRPGPVRLSFKKKNREVRSLLFKLCSFLSRYCICV